MSKKTIQDILNRKEKYREDVLESLEKKEKKVAFHFNCPDGLVSASIIRYLFSLENLEFIPVDYSLLKSNDTSEQLKNAEWFAIVDLEPFNLKITDYFFDHHITNENKEINSKEHVFKSGAPSAASLIAQYFTDLLPDYLKELAAMTEITDTASYNTPPPLELVIDVSMDWDDKIWLLEDSCKTAFSVKEHKEIIEILAFEGLEGLTKPNVENRVRKLRDSRKLAYDIAYNAEIKDFVIIIDRPLHYNTAFISSEVMKRGAKGTAYLTEYPNEVKISFRLSKALSKKKIEKYRVDLLAKNMFGGGHKGASGAETDSIDEALTKIEKWVKEKKLKTTYIDLGGTEEKGES